MTHVPVYFHSFQQFDWDLKLLAMYCDAVVEKNVLVFSPLILHNCRFGRDKQQATFVHLKICVLYLR